MKRVQSRSELKDKILLTLGHPYIRVDLSDAHIDLAVDTALRHFFKHSPYGSFESHYIYTITDDDITNGYIPVPRYIDAVVEVIPGGIGLSSMSFMTVEYQMQRETAMAAMRFSNVSLVDFVTMKERLYNTSLVLSQPKGFEFVRYQRRLIPYFNVTSGQTIALKCYENVDPEAVDVGMDPDKVISSVDLWDDEVLKDLAVAECKILWGNILRKFGQVVLPGGVTLDGQKILEEGKSEAASIIKELSNQSPIDFFMG